jgi:hypothetical protein
MSALGAARVSWRPLETAAELGALAAAAEAQGTHWAWPGACWCRKRHQAGETRLTLVAPPWRASGPAQTAGAVTR